MSRWAGPVLFFLLAGFLWTACQRETIIPPPDSGDIPERPSIIPAQIDSLPCVYIVTPKAVKSKEEWVDLSDIRIEVRVNDQDITVYEADGLQIKGRGNSTWLDFPKRPYVLKLKEKANLIGTGKTRHWVLLANWMDRTLLRNQVAFEAARRTSLEWTPSGVFVKLYMNDPESITQPTTPTYQGIYWLGEKIRVEGSHFDADYLYCYDTSDKGFEDYTAYCHFFEKGEWQEGEVPVTLKYPDKDDYPDYYWISYLRDASLEALQEIEESIYYAPTGNWLQKIDLVSFVDWFLVNELCHNTEVRHPKSCYFYIRNGIMYAGPVWDFDYGTFLRVEEYPRLRIKSSLYYFHLFPLKAFRNCLHARWKVLKPRFESLVDYVDEQAEWIRGAEYANHEMWNCYPNPLATEEEDFMINKDENLTFQEAIDRMKEAIRYRIAVMDEQFDQL